MQSIYRISEGVLYVNVKAIKIVICLTTCSLLQKKKLQERFKRNIQQRIHADTNI